MPEDSQQGGHVFLPVALALVIAFFAYFFAPLLGAFFIRRNWRLFRLALVRARNLPFLTYRSVSAATDGADLGECRFFGGIEAIEGGSLLWARGQVFGGKGVVSVSVDMADAKLYSLPESTSASFKSDDNERRPRQVAWRDLSAMQEGTKVFVWGPVMKSSGRAFFRSKRGSRVHVFLYECDEAEILDNALKLGRQGNEYWNNVTPVSWFLGALLMIIVMSRFNANSVGLIVQLTAQVAFLPLSAFLPPGLAFFLAYLAAWRRARAFRVARDFIILPVLPFEGTERDRVTAASGETIARVVCSGAPRRTGSGWEADTPGGTRVVIDGEMAMRGEEESRATGKLATRWICFGAVAGDGRGDGEAGSVLVLSRPSDPMGDFVAVPCCPRELSARCEKKAGAYTLMSGFALAFALLANNLLAFLVIRYLLRQ